MKDGKNEPEKIGRRLDTIERSNALLDDTDRRLKAIKRRLVRLTRRAKR